MVALSLYCQRCAWQQRLDNNAVDESVTKILQSYLSGVDDEHRMVCSGPAPLGRLR